MSTGRVKEVKTSYWGGFWGDYPVWDDRRGCGCRSRGRHRTRGGRSGGRSRGRSGGRWC